MLTFHNLHSFLENLTPSSKLRCVSDLILNRMVALCILGADVGNEQIFADFLPYVTLSLQPLNLLFKFYLLFR